MADATSRITHLYDWILLCHLQNYFPQTKPLRFPPLTTRQKKNLTTMLHTKLSHKVSLLPSTRKTPPHGWMKIPPDFQGIKEPIQFLQIFYKHLHYGILSAEGGPVKNLSRNTSDPLDRSSWTWGKMNPRNNTLGKNRLLVNTKYC